VGHAEGSREGTENSEKATKEYADDIVEELRKRAGV
jgi:hypothetical protein